MQNREKLRENKNILGEEKIEVKLKYIHHE